MSDEDRKYVMIENLGTVGTGLLDVLGASTARGDDAMIGQFGSGAKNGVALLLRHGVRVIQYIGKQGWEFGFDNTTDRDVRNRAVEINQVYRKGIAGPSRAKKLLGFDIDFGVADWHDPGRALCEFMSNAADASWTLKGDYSACQILYKDEDEIKGEEGYTRIFVEMTPDIARWDLKKYFMIFDKDYDPTLKILPKRSPNSGLRVHRKGVLVGEVEHHKSLWDYNLPTIRVNESRVISSEDARSEIGLALKMAPVDILERWMTAVRDNENLYEVTQVSSYALELDAYDDNREERLSAWQTAFRNVFTDGGVICDTVYAVEGARRKGYNPVMVKPHLKRVLQSFGLRTSGDVLDHFEAVGRTKVELDAQQMGKMVAVWEALVEMGVTKDRDMPAIEGFHTVMDAGSLTLAYYDFTRDMVGMSADVITDGGFDFVKAAIEEYAHAITKARDETRDLQDWAFRVAAILLDREFKRCESTPVKAKKG